MRRCRLCRKPAVADSMFCATHQQQAKTFATAFSPGDETAETSPPAEPSEGAALPDLGSDPSSSAAQAKPRTRVTTRTSRLTRTGAITTSLRRDEEPGFDPTDTSREALAFRLHQCLEKIRSRAREHAERDNDRWPQISVYTLSDEVLARPYYSIIPAAAKLAPPASEATEITTSPYRVTENKVLDWMTPGGVVFERFADLFSENLVALQERSLQTLDVHFLTYAGLVAINAHLPDQRERNLETFRLRDGELTMVPADDVRAQLHHDRW